MGLTHAKVKVWPDVAIIIPTYNRADVCAQTIRYLRSNLVYSGLLRFFVGCDGTDNTPSTVAPLLIRDCDQLFERPSGSLGANVNRLVRAAQSERIDYYFALDDDHHLLQAINLDKHVAKLINDLSAAWIHLLMEARGDEHFDPYRFSGVIDTDHYWRIDWACAERFVMSFRPHLFSKKWLECMGWLAEGLKSGETEWEYSGRTKRLGPMSGLDVLVPVCAYGREFWAHDSAESWNQRGF